MAALILLGILFLGGNPVSEWTVAQTTQIPALAGMPGQQQGTEAGGRKIDFAACLDSAGKAGIDYILLPEDLSEDVQKELQEAADGRLRSFGEYFLIEM